MDKAYPPEAWRRLGRALEARRGQLGYGFRQRERFLADHGGPPPSVKTLARLERGERTAYPPGTVTRLESLYELASGSFGAFLEAATAGRDAELLRADSRPAPLRPVPAVPAAAGGTVEEVAQEILDGILSRYPDDDAVQAIGVRPGWRAPQRVVEILRILGDRELSQEVLDGLTARYPDDGVVEAIGARQSRRNPAVRVLDVFAWLRWLESDPELSQGENGMTGLTCCVLSEI